MSSRPTSRLTQFYKIAVDNDAPFYQRLRRHTGQRHPGGTNANQEDSAGSRNSDWSVTVFGDGFDPAVDPENSNIVYSQWQYGGLVRFDRSTGQRVDIKPQTDKDGPALRWNWDSALMISPHASSRLYYGSQILFRSDDRGNSWRAVSPDLTRNLDRNQLKVMGRVWGVDAVAKNDSTSFYGTIVAISESPLVEDLLYVGTDDGLIQISEDGGKNWRKVERFPHLDVPEFAYVSDIEASLHDPDTVYAVLYNYKRGDFRPYVVRSSDRGNNWTLISGDLPERGSTYTIAEDDQQPNLLFVGTEFGLFFTIDGGEKWLPLKGGLPTIAVRDLEIQRTASDLVMGTFGRGFYVLDNYAPLRELSNELLEKPGHLFTTPKALMYIPSDPLAGGTKAYQGAGFFTAPNPPFGATFTYYIKDSLKSQKAQRQEQDQKKAQKQQDVAYPSWDELKAEDREEAPSVALTIRDSGGHLVRRIPGANSKGIHRTTWDYRYPGFTPAQLNRDGYGPLVVPGRYTVSLSQVVDGKETELIEPTYFVVEPLGMSSLPEQDRRRVLAFQRKVGELQRAALGTYRVLSETGSQLALIRKVIDSTPGLDPALAKKARELELRREDLLEQFQGDPTRPKRNEPAPPGLLSRIQKVVYGHWDTTVGPTDTHRKSYDIAASEFEAVLKDVRKFVDRDLKALERKLEAARAPWTPGRGIPNWKRN
jgi:hypothetical protein